jgi:hypothetical protein
VRIFLRFFVILFIGVSLVACGKIQDKDGKPVKVDQKYLMTEEGLELIKEDPDADKAKVGKEYVMVQDIYLKDQDENRLRYGSDYTVTDEGLKLKVSRHIRGTVVDSSEKPLSGVRASIVGLGHETVTGEDGLFKLPLVRGYVMLAFDVPGAPLWCVLPNVEKVSLSLTEYPEEWDAGTIELPCVLKGSENGRNQWATVSGEYVDNGDETVSDTKDGLMWQAKVQAEGLSHDRAVEYSEGLRLGGYSNWRLPTRKELEMLYHTKIACGWHKPQIIRGAMNLWASESGESSSGSIFNICSGRSRSSGSGSTADVLAVRFIGE